MSVSYTLLDGILENRGRGNTPVWGIDWSKMGEKLHLFISQLNKK